MNIRHITCSDPREDVPVNKLIELLKISDKVEIGIQAHKSSMTYLMPKFDWCNNLICSSEKSFKPLNIAIHVNYEWCDIICNGQFPPELSWWFFSKNANTGLPTIKRWQLNIGDNTKKIFSCDNLAKIIKRYPNREFIFPYNEKPSVKQFISRLHNTGAKFSLLFDSSYGVGKSPEFWQSPVYENIPNGYAGGLGPDNIHNQLIKIKSVVPENYNTWIDAEGKLMKPGTREFDIIRAENYIRNALQWIDKQK